MTVRRKLF